MGRDVTLALCVFVALPIAGCATYRSQTTQESNDEVMTGALHSLRERAAFELGCPRATIDVQETEPGSLRYTAAGCGKVTTFQARCEYLARERRDDLQCVVWDTASSAEPPDRRAMLRASPFVMPLSKRATNAVRAEAERELACSDVAVIQVSVDAKDPPPGTMWEPERDAREAGTVGASGCGKRTYYRVECELGLNGCKVEPTPAPQ